MDRTSGRPRESFRLDPLPGPAPDIGRWLWALGDGRQRPLARLAGLAPALVEWPAPEGGNSIGTLLGHVAAMEMDWLYSDVLEQPLPPAVRALLPPDVRDAQGRLLAVVGATLAAQCERLAATRAVLLAVYQSMSVAEFRRVRQLPHYDVTPEWVLYHLLQHEAEHGGELGMVRARAEHALGGGPGRGPLAAALRILCRP